MEVAMWFVTVALAAEPALVVEVVGARSASGVVACQIFTSEAGFPEDDTRSVARSVARVEGGHATCTFAEVPAGRYAVAVIHDEDNDLKLGRNFLGIPNEGYAFTRDALGTFGTPPSFGAAAVQGAGPWTIHLVY